MHYKRQFLQVLLAVTIVLLFTLSLAISAQTDADFIPISFIADVDADTLMLSDGFSYNDSGDGGNELTLGSDGSMQLTGVPGTRSEYMEVLNGPHVVYTIGSEVVYEVEMTLNGPYSEAQGFGLNATIHEGGGIAIRVPGEELPIGYLDMTHSNNDRFKLSVGELIESGDFYRTDNSEGVDGDTQTVRVVRYDEYIRFQFTSGDRFLTVGILGSDDQPLPDELEMIFFTYSNTDDESSITFNNLGVANYIAPTPRPTRTPEPTEIPVVGERTTYPIGLSVIVPEEWDQEVVDSRFPFGDISPDYDLDTYDTLLLLQRNFGQVLFTRVDSAIFDYGIQTRGQFMDLMFGEGSYGPFSVYGETIYVDGAATIVQTDVQTEPGFQYRLYYAELASFFGIYNYVMEVVAPESTFEAVNEEALRILGTLQLQN